MMGTRCQSCQRANHRNKAQARPYQFLHLSHLLTTTTAVQAWAPPRRAQQQLLHQTMEVEGPQPARRRHLMSLWLAPEAGPPLADPYYEFMDKTASGRPNGYLMPGVKLTAPLVVEDGGPGASEQRVANS